MSKSIPKTVSEYMAEIGRKGGKAKTPKKINAARRNAVRSRRVLQKLFPPKDE